MSMKSSFRAVLERRERTKAKSPVRSASPVPFVLVLDDVKQPIELLRLLKKYGLSLQGTRNAQPSGQRRNRGGRAPRGRPRPGGLRICRTRRGGARNRT